jgi:hypothetical protein
MNVKSRQSNVLCGNQWSGALSLAVKRRGLVAYHLSHLESKHKNGGAILLFPICLHGVELNQLNVGNFLLFLFTSVPPFNHIS